MPLQVCLILTQMLWIDLSEPSSSSSGFSLFLKGHQQFFPLWCLFVSASCRCSSRRSSSSVCPSPGCSTMVALCPTSIRSATPTQIFRWELVIRLQLWWAESKMKCYESFQGRVLLSNSFGLSRIRLIVQEISQLTDFLAVLHQQHSAFLKPLGASAQSFVKTDEEQPWLVLFYWSLLHHFKQTKQSHCPENVPCG